MHCGVYNMYNKIYDSRKNSSRKLQRREYSPTHFVRPALLWYQNQTNTLQEKYRPLSLVYSKISKISHGVPNPILLSYLLCTVMLGFPSWVFCLSSPLSYSFYILSLDQFSLHTLWWCHCSMETAPYCIINKYKVELLQEVLRKISLLLDH